MKQHLKSHQEPVYRCQEKDCNYSSNNKTGFDAHFRKKHDETGEPRFKCLKCNEEFKFFKAFKEHQMIVCDAPNRPHACEFCRRRFKLKQGLCLHYHEHHHLSVEVARQKVYPGLRVPVWVSKKYRDEKRKERKNKTDSS